MPDPSPAFNPPMNRVIDSDPQIIRIPLEKTDWGFRKSQQPDVKSEGMALRHVKNGQ